ncbi:MAG: uroporphyrinogen decarboxylase [Chloroflexi bacterium]|nr:uroporphyrinogen decarboxylase [Chloroflexota bacterium]
MTLSKRERLEKTIAGEKTDRVPVALWRHWPGDDQRPADLVNAVVDFQTRWDWDFIKITPASSYCVTDYGVQDEWQGSLEGTREYTRRVVSKPVDWTTLRELDPLKGTIGQQVETIKLMNDAIKGDVPFIQTIFNPLSQAKNIAGEDVMIQHLRTAPEKFKEGLEIITRNTIKFLDALRKTKMAGIFFAIQHASYSRLTRAEYEEFGKPFDLQILNALDSNWWFNMMHLHGPLPMFDLVADYPVQAINWHDQETEPDLPTGKKMFGGAVSGGLGRFDVYTQTPTTTQQQARQAIESVKGERFILSTGCVIMTNTPISSIRAIREIVEV